LGKKVSKKKFSAFASASTKTSTVPSRKVQRKLRSPEQYCEWSFTINVSTKLQPEQASTKVVDQGSRCNVYYSLETSITGATSSYFCHCLLTSSAACPSQAHSKMVETAAAATNDNQFLIFHFKWLVF